MLTIKELYNDAIIEKEGSLLLFLDFLLKEKKVVKLNDDVKELDRYFAEKNKPRMNELLKAYAETPRGKQLIGG